MPENPSETGRLLGHYRLTRRLGQGGFAEVYLGEHVHLHTFAAIKVLHTRLADDAIQQFQREAQFIARLQHPNIVRVLDFGVDGGVPYLVMDYAANGTLRSRFPSGQMVPLVNVVSFTKQVAEALYYAHEQRLIHRDIKPENMLLGSRQELLLSDFGIALALQSSHLNSIQNIAGTISYMAPEQIEAHPVPASDQYALAIVVYEWLCGQRPFQGSYTEIAVKHSITPPPSLRQYLPGLPEPVERVVMIALQKQPQQRFPDVRAFAQALEQATQSASSQQFVVTQLKAEFQPAPSPALSQQFVATQLKPEFLSTAQHAYTPSPVAPPFSTPGSGNVPPVSMSTPLSYAPGPVLPGGAERASSAMAYPQKQRALSRRTFLFGGLAGGAVSLLAVGGVVAWHALSQPQVAQNTLQTVLSGNTSRGIPGLTPAVSPLLSYKEHKAAVLLARWSADGSYIASGSMDSTARIWSTDQGQTRLSIISKKQPPMSDDYPWSLAWSHTSQWLAVGFVDGTIQVLDLKGGQAMASLATPVAPLALVTWSPDEHYLAVVSGSSVLVYRYPDWSIVTTYQRHTNTVKALSWSPDGKYLASGSEDTQVHVWEPLTGQVALLYTEHTDDIASLCWSPDSTRVVSTAHDQTARVWELSTKHTLYTYARPSGAPIGEARWSHNGQTIAVYNGNAQIDFLAASTGKITHSLASGVAFNLDWSPDDTRLVTGNYDNTARIWRV
ncbi:MAG TPA: serine/threonine-protein kinase [Ktedonobacteraceae bacterium]|nr:serine/threonine-protein kinase [Ktedonobacteraceae bacterium]